MLAEIMIPLVDMNSKKTRMNLAPSGITYTTNSPQTYRQAFVRNLSGASSGYLFEVATTSSRPHYVAVIGSGAGILDVEDVSDPFGEGQKQCFRCW